MKLAFCLSYYFPYGGMQQDFMRIATECHARGHEIDAYTTSWEGDKPNWLTLHKITTNKNTNHELIKEFAHQINTLTKPKKYDLIIGFNKMPGLDIYFAADSCFTTKPQYRNILRRITSRYRTYAKLEQQVFTPQSKTQILILSQTEQNKYQTQYNTQPERFHQLPPAVNPNRIPPDNVTEIRNKTRQTYGTKPDDYLLVTIGSSFRIKGVDRSIKALASLPPELKNKTQLLVIGNDKRTEKYQTLAKKLSVEQKIRFLGIRYDIPNLLFASDLLIHPARVESAGMVIVEAIASETPVLVTNNCGYATHVKQSGAGECIPTPYDQKQMNQQLANILNQQTLTKYQQKANTYRQKTDLHNLAKNAADVIEKCAKTK